MKFEITVTLKQEVLDPQGSAVLHTLKSLGHESVQKVRQGKSFEIDLSENDESKNLEKIKKNVWRSFVNSVIEDYKIKKIWWSLL